MERHEIDYLRRSIAVLQPATGDAVGREASVIVLSPLSRPKPVVESPRGLRM
jgi:hypothetical protein